MGGQAVVALSDLKKATSVWREREPRQDRRYRGHALGRS